MSSKSKIIVECSHGHRFPVNLKKHTNRRYVFCPTCREEVNVRKRLFGPNPEWEKNKEELKEARLMARSMKKRAPKEGIPMVLPGALTPTVVMARAMLIQHELEKRRRKESERKGEN